MDTEYKKQHRHIDMAIPQKVGQEDTTTLQYTL